jgi:hypothetical protein
MTPIATKNNAIIVKDGKLAENCECCGDWWCYLDPSATDCHVQCGSQSLSMSLAFVMSPQLGSPRFGEAIQSGLSGSFPMSMDSLVSLPLSSTPGFYYIERGYNSLGRGESLSQFGITISNSSDVCSCKVRVTSVFIIWKWDMSAGSFSPGDATREPAGFQYAELVVCRPDFANSPLLEFTFAKGQTPCFTPTAISVTGKSVPGRGSATGSVTVSA